MHIKKTFLSRTWSTAKLTGKFGMSAFKKMAESDQVDPEKALQYAIKLANELDGLKGLLMKFGQMASYMGSHLPLEAREVLAKLQSDSHAIEFSSVRAIIERELGKPLESCFDHFEEEAFAAASIGQVHRARLDGREVVIKVQYPDIERLLQYDLKWVGGLFAAMMTGQPTDGRAVAAELEARLLEECDYLQEAEHQCRIKKLFDAQPDSVSVPGVIRSHTTRHVITSEFIDALNFQEFLQQSDQAAKNRAALMIFKANINSIFEHCFFNGDPHPGNYLFTVDGAVTLLDFGCVKKFPLKFVEQWKCMAFAILDHDFSRFCQAVETLGIVGNPKKFDYDFHWHTMQVIYEPYLSTKLYTYTREHFAQCNRLLIWENKNRFSVKMPPDLLFANRLQWGMAALLSDMQASNLWRDTFVKTLNAEINPLFSGKTY